MFQMLRSGIPGITEKGVQFVQSALLPGLTDTQSTAFFTRYVVLTAGKKLINVLSVYGKDY